MLTRTPIVTQGRVRGATDARCGEGLATSRERSTKQRDGSHLLDIPHQESGGTDHALEVPTIGGHLRPLPGWDVGHGLEDAPLYRRQLSPLAECLRFDSLSLQRFDRVVFRPSEPSGVAVGLQHHVDIRIESVAPDPGGAKDVPADFIRRFL